VAQDTHRHFALPAAALNRRFMGVISLLPLVRFWRRRVYLQPIAKAEPGGISFFPFLCFLHTFGFDVQLTVFLICYRDSMFSPPSVAGQWQAIKVRCGWLAVAPERKPSWGAARLAETAFG
jgi:hypothetical protein